MQVLLHGGFCCGIKHIAGLSNPMYSASERHELTGDQTSYGRSVFSSAVNDMHREIYGEDFFYKEAPMEKYPERLKRLVEFVKAERPHGLIEIVTQKTNQSAWKKHLEELGFKMVTEFKNSNTNQLLLVWHLAY